ncbi:MAG: hypothetical protein A3A80_00090 [Candidatus Terrybacteria bacterium RIFCSPLOWO2_01_FULL_44_24]|uniref:Uncharacterized protein n=1 Tax=Candidatus Terrybacteria bacterium RIFCSPHIGHO2_01_FULL_43_35 TaxID=1802361 RepID=A0A1G2PI41_9BACT|nr:MAG: hypothetical protein A2828_03435 [Candidatus Terrybacteria bacterium RIFCSPHIGHO2_01_FULL_43_35]OHA50458.1 MAG: hypothetical protein A3B75_00905 [Candidatus Terrybacteria bacterium RIFCSPHIGHO2_02_FULL_43_14]OHA51084.1 MAG: hypothetical protein A3A80_00090 [Candidatus Terrybacteria bacterium RIFCSPLOWO2_01_FULL_44_24]
MKNRAFKRITVLAIIFGALILGVFIYAQIQTKPTPSCFDKIKNQGEYDVDCGGPCLACKGHPEPLSIGGSVLIPAENRKYDLVFMIINPNLNYGASSVDYNIEIDDAQGKKIYSRNGSTFVLPKEANSSAVDNLSNSSTSSVPKGRWIIEHGLNGVPDATAKISFSDISWEGIKDNFAEPRLLILNKIYNILLNSAEFSEATGILKNDSPFGFDLVEIQVLLFDENDQLIGARRTEARTVTAGERREFRVSWRNSIPNVSRLEMIAYTNVFLNDNFIDAFGTRERFQQLNPVVE